MTTWTVALPLREEYVDYLGHVTAAAHLALCEEARTHWLMEMLLEEQPAFVLVRQELDYRHELLQSDGPVTVSVEPVALTRSTVTVQEAIVSLSGTTHTESRAVLVRWDREERRAMAFLPAERDRISRRVIP